jgi:predicted esterase YcpF (UPF0227 family)
MKSNIVYLHGFASGGSSAKGVLLKKHFSKTCNIVLPDLSEKPAEAIKQIERIISEPGNFIFVGTSLGGFYADYFNKFADIPCVLINPLVEPEDMMRHIGINRNYATGKEFSFTKKDFDYLLYLRDQKTHISYTDSPEYILLAKDDDVIDYKESLQYFINDNQYVKVFPSGGHRFTNDAEIVKAIELLLEDIDGYNFSNLYSEKVFESKIHPLNERYINLFSISEKKKYWPEVEDMIRDAYAYIGGYKGDITEFLGNEYLWKLVRKDGEIKAGKIYKDKLGRKSVCGFTDGTAEGKLAFKVLVKEDLKLGRSWAEVSGKMENIFKYSAGATPFPHSVVKIIMEVLHKDVQEWNPDGYHYTRNIDGQPVEKAIYGKIDI